MSTGDGGSNILGRMDLVHAGWLSPSSTSRQSCHAQGGFPLICSPTG
jgi:hypothetical protein